MSKSKHVATKILCSILTVVAVVLLVVQIPSVQSATARRLLAAVSESLGGQIEIGEFRVLPFNTIAASDVLVSGGPEDTLIYARSAVIQFSLNSLFGKSIRFHKGTINEGYFNMKGEGDSTNISRIFKVPEVIRTGKEIMSFSNLGVEGLRVRISDIEGIPDFDINTNLKTSNFKIRDNGIYCRIDNFNCLDISGIEIKSLKTKLDVGEEGVKIDDLSLSDGYSDISIPHFTVTFDEIPSFDGRIRKTLVSSKTLVPFIPALEKIPAELRIEDFQVSGPLDDITVSKFAFTELTRNISADLNLSAGNLPDIANTRIALSVNRLSAPYREIPYEFTGKVSGLLNDLGATGELCSPTGKITADVSVRDLLNEGLTTVGGSVSSSNFNVGDILGSDAVGECSLGVTASASFGKELSSLTVNDLKINKLEALEYSYSGISGSGTYFNNSFDGRIISLDPNLNFSFDGICHFGKAVKDALYKFHLDLRNADLQELKFDKRGASKVSLEITADFNGNEEGDLLGTIDILDIKLENDGGPLDIGDININSRMRDGANSLDFKSDFADASYRGSQNFTKIFDDLKFLILSSHIPSVSADYLSERDGEDDFNIGIDFHDSRDLLSFVYPGLYIADSTSVNLDVAKDGALQCKVESSRLALQNNYLKDFRLAIDNSSGSLAGRITSSQNKLAGIVMENNSISTFAHDDRIGVSFEFDNKTEAANKAELLLTALFERDEDGNLSLTAENLASELHYEGTQWNIEPAQYRISGDGVSIGNLSISSGDQSLILYGGISSARPDTIRVGLNNFDLSMLNSLLGGTLKIGGRLSGSADVFSPFDDNFGLVANLSGENTTISDMALGNLSIHSLWNEELSGMTFDISNNLEGTRTIAANGILSPESGSIDAGIRLNSFNAGYFKPFIEEVFSDVGGAVSGRIDVSGPFNDLSLSSKNTTLENGFLKIGFTNVTYYVAGPFHVNDEGVYFDDIGVVDSDSGRGIVRGGFDFNNFKSVEVNTKIQFSNTELINLGVNEGEIFYGKIFGTGNLAISGPLDKVVLDGEATTARNGNFHLPLGNLSEDTSINLLTFKEDKKDVWEDPYLKMISSMNEVNKSESSLGMRFSVSVTPETNIFLELDKAGDNVLSGLGTGYVDIVAGMQDNPFSINGDYSLQSGKYHLGLLGITKKDFDIKSGSSIKFNGDIMNSDIDIDALYTTKTSISNLISDTTAVASRRNVECGLRIYDKLRNPQLGFSIDVPDLDPTVKSRVESALNTSDKIQKQFLSLLVTNSFLPDEQSGIVNNTNLLYSNVSEIMSNQLNNILQELKIPFDLGLSYQSSEGGTNIFDVAISTQLFNNRVLVNGNIGNRQYSTSSSQDVVGDLDIEIKLDKTGAVRMSLFSHSADDYTNFLDNLQRSGVGVAYQKEFDKLNRIFKEAVLNSEEDRQTRTIVIEE